MTRPTHTDLLHARLLDGERLTADDERHVATCADCQRAVADAGRLDERLRGAAASLAAEPLPAGMLELAQEEPLEDRRSTFAPAVAGAAAVILAVSLTLALAQLRPPVADDPSPTPSASAPSILGPTPSGAATPSPIPSSAAGEDPYFVLGGERCADAAAGFTLLVPEDWHATRRSGSQPACRELGPGHVAEGHRSLDPIVRLTPAPTYDPTAGGAVVTDERQVELANGNVATRYETHVPESGALAASDGVAVVIPLLAPDERGPGGVLVASADPSLPGSVEALAAIVATIELQPAISLPPTTAEGALQYLYRDRDVCIDEANGWGVVFPDAWWTNTPVDELDGCSWFAPESFEVGADGTIPDEVELSLMVVDAATAVPDEVVSYETATVIDRPATRREVTRDGSVGYEYAVLLSDAPDGPVLLARTHLEDGDDEALARVLLDELVDRIGRGAPPPGAASDAPPIEAPPVSASDADAEFRLDLVVEQGRYRAGQPILADATLTYLGDADLVHVRGSGTGIVMTTVRQLDGEFDQGGASTSDCVPSEIERDDPLHVPFGKTGSWSEEDPLAGFRRAYFADPFLRLPPGRWEISASTGFYAGGGDCGEGRWVSLTASVDILVDP